ncbi:MAG: uracil-DNA glycosylase [Thermoguttaceae bacterium]|nr:uracil-DNA glycosylase [Thermoguttaceae bacterium]
MRKPPRLTDLLADFFEDANQAGVTDLPGAPVSEGASLPEKTLRADPGVEPPIQISDVMAKQSSQTPLEKTLAQIKPGLSTRAKEALLRDLAQAVSKCVLCPELVANRTQTVFGVGNPDAELVFVGEGPGADEDRQGVPFVGRSGQLLTDIIVKGMKMRREDVYICNVVRCRPPQNRNPLPSEAAFCRPFLDGTLRTISPKYICCLGSVAAQNLLQTDQSIGKLRGKVHDYRGIEVVCTYHPAYLLRNPAAKRDTWEDIKLLLRRMGRM